MKAFGLIVGILGAVICSWTMLIMAVRSEFFPDSGTIEKVPDQVRIASANSAVATKLSGRTPSEEVTGQVRPTPHPGLSPEPAMPRTEGKEFDLERVEVKKSDLERLSESHARKLADLKRGLVGPSSRVTNAADSMDSAVRKFRLAEQRFETEMAIRNKNPLLDLPAPALAQPPDAQQILSLDAAITEFEKAIAGYISASKEAVFEFHRQTKGVTRQGEADRDWLEEALAVSEVSQALFLCHARQRLVDLYSSGRFDLWPNLAGVAQAPFTLGCTKSINEARFAQDRSYTPCFVDKALLVIAQDHAEEMARVDKTLPTYVIDDPGVSRRLGGGLTVKAINSYCVGNEQLPADPAFLIKYILKQKSGAILLSDESRVGVGTCRSKTGKWYISLLLAAR